jgi:hypothetical protein
MSRGGRDPIPLRCPRPSHKRFGLFYPAANCRTPLSVFLHHDPHFVRLVFRYFLPGALAGSIAHAALLTQGVAVIDYDATAWASLAADTGYPMPALSLAAFLDQAQASSLTYPEVLAASQPHPNYLGQRYVMNGPTLTNLAGRTAQPSSFDYHPDVPSQSTGVIGLGGITRFAVSGGGSLLFGDFTFGFDPTRVSRGGSGWFLKGNIPPAAVAFDLLDVQIQNTSSSLEVSANLGVSFEVANFLLATPSDTLRVVGHFHFAGSSHPSNTSPPAIRQLQLFENLVQLECHQGAPGGSFQVLHSSDLSQPLASWSVVGQGTFDAQGECQTAVPHPPGETTGWYRLRVP